MFGANIRLLFAIQARDLSAYHATAECDSHHLKRDSGGGMLYLPQARVYVSRRAGAILGAPLRFCGDGGDNWWGVCTSSFILCHHPRSTFQLRSEEVQRVQQRQLRTLR